jgi:pimeloyl-ACP methyl ester carboxylesterase
VRNIEHFKQFRRVLVPDIPGLGDSDDAPDPTPDGIGRVIAQGLGQLVKPVERLDIVGFSFGSLVGAYAAQHYRSPLTSLTLVGAGALGLPRTNIILHRTDHEMEESERAALHKLNLAMLMIADPDRIDDLAVTIQHNNVGKARVKSRRFANSENITHALRQSRPDHLHVIWGEQDAVAAGQFAEREAVLRAVRPDLTFKLISDAGHWASYENAPAFNAYLTEILR